MLINLIKYDLKHNAKLLLIIHGFILILSIIMNRFLWLQSQGMTEDYVSVFAYGIIIFVIALIYAALAIFSMFGLQIYIAVRFYRNLFTNEGYLMHSLPVTPVQLLNSKIISGLILTLFNLCIVSISVLLLFSTYLEVFTSVDGIVSLLQAQFVWSNLPSLLYALLGFLCSLVMMFACICLGQLFNKGRMIASVVIYMGLNLLIQTIQSSIVLSNNSAIAATYNYLTSGSISYALSVFNLGLTFLVLFVIPGIIYYLICLYIMNKKVNLL